MLPELVTTAIDTYKVDALSAVGLVLVAGCTVYFAAQIFAAKDFSE